jgi:hypothetical protein
VARQLPDERHAAQLGSAVVTETDEQARASATAPSWPTRGWPITCVETPMPTTTLILGASAASAWSWRPVAGRPSDRHRPLGRRPASLAAMGAQALRLDVADPASISGLAWQLDGEQLDTAWYVAGVMCTRSDARQPPTAPEFDRVMHANVRGAMQSRRWRRWWRRRAGARLQHHGPHGEVDWLYRVSKAALNMAVASAQPSYPAGRVLAPFTLAGCRPTWVAPVRRWA